MNLITTDEIAIRMYQILQESEVKNFITGEIDWVRNDYTKEDVVIVPHYTQGELQSRRLGVIKVNIHVPDLSELVGNDKRYIVNLKRLIEIRQKVVNATKDVNLGEGWCWNIETFNPAIKEPNFNEHFFSLDYEVIILKK